MERHEDTSSEVFSNLTNSATSSSKGAADSLITPKPRSSSLSYTRFWVKCTLGSFPWTAQILSQPARSWKLRPLVQTIRVSCCFLYAVSDWILDLGVLEMSGVINCGGPSSGPSQWTSSKPNDGWKWRTELHTFHMTSRIEESRIPRSTLNLIWFSFGGWIKC